MHAWARRLSVGYALLSIVMHVVTFVYQLLYIVPATNAFYERQPNLGGVGAMMGTITSISLFVSLLFVLYPIAVLIILLSPANAAAFRGEGQPPAEIPEDFPDDRWKEPPSEAIQR
jgi:hypothetical protein